MIQPEIIQFQSGEYVYYADVVDAVMAESRGSLGESVVYDDVSDSVRDVIDWYHVNGRGLSESKARREVIRHMGGFWALVFPWLLSAVARFVINEVVPWLYSNEPSAVLYRGQIKG